MNRRRVYAVKVRAEVESQNPQGHKVVSGTVAVVAGSVEQAERLALTKFMELRGLKVGNVNEATVGVCA